MNFCGEIHDWHSECLAMHKLKDTLEYRVSRIDHPTPRGYRLLSRHIPDVDSG